MKGVDLSGNMGNIKCCYRDVCCILAAFVASYIAPDYIAAVAHTTCSGLVMLLLVLVSTGGESLGGILYPPTPPETLT